MHKTKPNKFSSKYELIEQKIVILPVTAKKQLVNKWK